MPKKVGNSAPLHLLAAVKKSEKKKDTYDKKQDKLRAKSAVRSQKRRDANADLAKREVKGFLEAKTHELHHQDGLSAAQIRDRLYGGCVVYGADGTQKRASRVKPGDLEAKVAAKSPRLKKLLSEADPVHMVRKILKVRRKRGI